MEQHIIDLLKSLKIKMKFQRKINKRIIPTFRPILSAIGMPTYKLAKFCDKLLKPITTNEYAIKDSFSFAKEVEEFDPNPIMASFNVNSLFTNIPLTETIGLYVENLYRNQTNIDSLSKSSFCRLLEMTMYESFFIFDQKYYKQ